MNHFPRLSPVENLQVTLFNTVPSFARDFAGNDPSVHRLLDHLQVDSLMVTLFDRLRQRYNGRPVWTGQAGNEVLLVLSPDYVERVLGGCQLLYVPGSNRLRRLAASPHELSPHLDETMLEPNDPEPAGAVWLAKVVADEMSAFATRQTESGVVNWPLLRAQFERMARVTVFGNASGDDVDLTAAFHRLRRCAVAPPLTKAARRRANACLQYWNHRVTGYAHTAPADSLIGQLADTDVRPHGQVARWLSGMEQAATLTAGTLALLASHPEQLARVNEELTTAHIHHAPDSADAVAAQPYLQACVLEASRLWPPVANLQHNLSQAVEWDGGMLASGTRMVVSTLHQHRSRYQGRRAHRFTPRLWMDRSLDGDWSVVPFSLGPGASAGAMLGAYLATASCAAILRTSHLRVLDPPLTPGAALPLRLNLGSLRFRLTTAEPDPAADFSHAPE